MLLMNHICSMNEKRRSPKDGPQTQIIAPRPFLDCLYKECMLTYKGIVETRGKSGRSGEASKTSEYFNLKFNGIIFPQPIRRICDLSRAVLKSPANAHLLTSVSI